MAMPFDNGFSDYNAERLRAADTLLLGRKSYEMFRPYWPGAEDASQPAVEREISRLNTAIQKVVVSNSLTRDKVEVGARLASCAVRTRTEIAVLKEKPGQESDIRQPFFGAICLPMAWWTAALNDWCWRGRRGACAQRPGCPARSACWTPAADGSSLLLTRYAVER